MILVHPSLISEIDRYARDSLGIPTLTLMRRAGEAVAKAVMEYVPTGSNISIFVGKGNNGGDGYAAACILNDKYSVKVYDVFAAGQRSEEGRHFLNVFISLGGKIESLIFDDGQISDISNSHCVVDAIFGTGFSGQLPDITLRLAALFESLNGIVKISVDAPLGINASDGTVLDGGSYHTDVTVVLGFVKTGLVSYPSKEYVGRLIYDNLGLQNNDILEAFDVSEHLIDSDTARYLLPKRQDNSNKGSFGKALVITGSDTFFGAAHLSVEAALRSGVGYVTFLGSGSACDSLIQKFPEAIYKRLEIGELTDQSLSDVISLARRHDAILIGSGSTVTPGLLKIIESLLSEEVTLILDADAINALAIDAEYGREVLRGARATVILTPHPLELSRISGIPVREIQADRFNVAKHFAKENNCILILKGAATVVTNGSRTYINSSGSSALAKAGSGDVLAGFLSGVTASVVDPLDAAALSVYLHGVAADSLSEELSEYGVTPSDLPKEMARQIVRLRNT